MPSLTKVVVGAHQRPCLCAKTAVFAQFLFGTPLSALRTRVANSAYPPAIPPKGGYIAEKSLPPTRGGSPFSVFSGKGVAPFPVKRIALSAESADITRKAFAKAGEYPPIPPPFPPGERVRSVSLWSALKRKT